MNYKGKKIKMLKSSYGSISGIDYAHFDEGKIYSLPGEISEGLAQNFVEQQKIAVVVDGISEPKAKTEYDNKAIIAPENKAVKKKVRRKRKK